MGEHHVGISLQCRHVALTELSSLSAGSSRKTDSFINMSTLSLVNGSSASRASSIATISWETGRSQANQGSLETS